MRTRVVVALLSAFGLWACGDNRVSSSVLVSPPPSGGDPGGGGDPGDAGTGPTTGTPPAGGLPTFAQRAYIKSSDTRALASFGASVALSADGSTLAVSADSESSGAKGINGDQADRSAPNSGAVYVFVRTGSKWQQQAYLKASNTDADDLFGYSISLSADGSTLAVGALFEDSSATGVDGDQGNQAGDSGAVYVFNRTAGEWTQRAYLKASNTAEGANFGGAVVLSSDGTTLAVGAQNEASGATGVDGSQTDSSAPDAGAVYVFGLSGDTWAQQAYIKASNTAAEDFFGTALALSSDGSTLAVSATGESSAATGIDGDQGSTSAANAGAVYVYVRNGAAWKQQAYVKASNTQPNNWFGSSLALSGDGTSLVVGGLAESGAGAVYTFGRECGAWSQRSYLKAVNGGGFGASLALSSDGATLGVGAYGESMLAGAAYMFARGDMGWTQTHPIKASNTDARDLFGQQLALSGDGSTLAVGATFEASDAVGIDGDQSDNSMMNAGAVYLFQ